MRLPDLNWPTDLFTDEAAAMLETDPIISRPDPSDPVLWADMLNAWLRTGAAPDRRVRAPAHEEVEFVW